MKPLNFKEHKSFNPEPIEHYSDRMIRFSFSMCKARCKYQCLSKLGKPEKLKSLYKRLGHFEKMTWQLLTGIPRERGITWEIKGSDSHKMLSRRFSDFTRFGHFRLEDADLFRVFVGKKNDLLYVLHFDEDGKIHH